MINEYGALVRELRVNRQWTQQSLAFHLGICVDHLRHIELGQSTASEKVETRIREWRDSEQDEPGGKANA